jgi:hypothetical protein
MSGPLSLCVMRSIAEDRALELHEINSVYPSGPASYAPEMTTSAPDRNLKD